MGLSVRTRFEVFKRDDFTCQYCGRKSPDVVLEVDHIVPICEGGGDDVVNLRTSCWDCNHGKAGKPLFEIVTGEDPHDRAVVLLERERQLREYNEVLACERDRRWNEGWELVRYWQIERGRTKEEDLTSIGRADWNWLFSALTWCPAAQIQNFMDIALGRQMTKNLKYVAACCRNWRYERTAHKDSDGGYQE
jgi:hypothetical protein